ncbi:MULTISPECIES: 1-aminocyclopropane-1-carboxylate deaminase/D-cysteine desulfhydrase [unclassified Micromonospora]|uniref:1-aminocyclopropane-1-carboxylate deaminase/D-cysteine desulfhydrase n=1 Tax=unclassified Micromonospora TaxID=2617518 RepID=UPI002FF3143A
MALPRVHARYPSIVPRLPFLPLGAGPTGVRRIDQNDLWIKDDSRYGHLYGGNKVRKLEWSLADLLRRRCRVVVTGGGTGSHHAVAVARYATAAGIPAHIVAVEQPYDQHVEAQMAAVRAAGATMYRVDSVAAAYATAGRLLVGAAVTGRRPGLLPVGGSNPHGCLGFVEAAFELAEQVAAGTLPAPRRIVVPVGSGGTAAGLILGVALAGLPTEVVGILVNDKTRVGPTQVRRMATATAALLRRHGAPVPDPVSLAPLQVRREWLGPGYGTPSAASVDAAQWLQHHTGLVADPVYTAKAAAALRELCRGRVVEGPTLYWHTAPAATRSPA